MRDANRCYVTEFYDTDMLQALPESEREDIRDDVTECAHIIPFSVGPANVGGKVDIDDVSSIWIHVPGSLSKGMLNLGCFQGKNMGLSVQVLPWDTISYRRIVAGIHQRSEKRDHLGPRYAESLGYSILVSSTKG